MGIRTWFRLPLFSWRLLVSVVLGVGSPLAWPASSLSFDEALRIAGDANPAVSATHARIDAARHEVGPAGELPDPKLVLALDNVPISGADRFTVDRDPMSAQRIGVMQEFPNRDKREARVAVAHARVERSEAERRVASLTARREAAIAWIRRYSTERQLEDLDALFEENRLLDATVRARLASGDGVAADAVMPRQEAALLGERRDTLMATRRQSIAAEAAGLGRGTGPGTAVAASSATG